MQAHLIIYTEQRSLLFTVAIALAAVICAQHNGRTDGSEDGTTELLPTHTNTHTHTRNRTVHDHRNRSVPYRQQPNRPAKPADRMDVGGRVGVENCSTATFRHRGRPFSADEHRPGTDVFRRRQRQCLFRTSAGPVCVCVCACVRRTPGVCAREHCHMFCISFGRAAAAAATESWPERQVVMHVSPVGQWLAKRQR